MAYKRILTIQDLSCVGQCSMAVALPVLSVCGHETCVLPTKILSTHTGGFGKPVSVSMDDALTGIGKHWQDNSIQFDAILIGYLGSIAAVDVSIEIRQEMLAPGGICIVDPAMADHGKLYAGFDEAYVQAVSRLCEKADILIPNETELAILSGLPYRKEATTKYVNRIQEKLGNKSLLVTGMDAPFGKIGVQLYTAAETWTYTHDRVDGNYSGTGDLFAACFTAALMQGKNRKTAAKIAADFVFLSLQNTIKDPAHFYGVKFETVLARLPHMLEEA